MALALALALAAAAAAAAADQMRSVARSGSVALGRSVAWTLVARSLASRWQHDIAMAKQASSVTLGRSEAVARWLGRSRRDGSAMRPMRDGKDQP